MVGSRENQRQGTGIPPTLALPRPVPALPDALALAAAAVCPNSGPTRRLR
jgi:hypothetical protein